jgi:hypothetical protein
MPPDRHPGDRAWPPSACVWVSTHKSRNARGRGLEPNPSRSSTRTRNPSLRRWATGSQSAPLPGNPCSSTTGDPVPSSNRTANSTDHLRRARYRSCGCFVDTPALVRRSPRMARLAFSGEPGAGGGSYGSMLSQGVDGTGEMEREVTHVATCPTIGRGVASTLRFARSAPCAVGHESSGPVATVKQTAGPVDMEGDP